MQHHQETTCIDKKKTVPKFAYGKRRPAIQKMLFENLLPPANGVRQLSIKFLVSHCGGSKNQAAGPTRGLRNQNAFLAYPVHHVATTLKSRASCHALLAAPLAGVLAVVESAPSPAAVV